MLMAPGYWENKFKWQSLDEETNHRYDGSQSQEKSNSNYNEKGDDKEESEWTDDKSEFSDCEVKTSLVMVLLYLTSNVQSQKQQ